MKITLMAFMVVLIIIMAMLNLMSMLSKKTIMDTQKSSPFECGFNPMSFNRIPFSIHFFMVAVIFLIFDIEIILIMPMIMTMKTSIIKYWLLTSMSFTLILTMGLLHEWNYGMLNWTK